MTTKKAFDDVDFYHVIECIYDSGVTEIFIKKNDEDFLWVERIDHDTNRSWLKKARIVISDEIVASSCTESVDHGPVSNILYLELSPPDKDWITDLS